MVEGEMFCSATHAHISVTTGTPVLDVHDVYVMIYAWNRGRVGVETGYPRRSRLLH